MAPLSRPLLPDWRLLERAPRRTTTTTTMSSGERPRGAGWSCGRRTGRRGCRGGGVWASRHPDSVPARCGARGSRAAGGRRRAEGYPNSTGATCSVGRVAISRVIDRVGQVLGGRYRLLAPIGTGASATVYLADDVVLRRRVAVKVLHDALADDSAVPQAVPGRGAQRRRPQPPAHHGGARLGPGRRALPGHRATSAAVRLRGLLDTGHRLDPAQARQVGLEAARALEYAHRRGLDPPRHQAGQPPLRRRGPPAHRRLRPGPGPGRGGLDRARRRRARHRPLRLARAGPGRLARRPQRRLLPRPGDHRVGHRRGPLRRRHHPRHAHGPGRQARPGARRAGRAGARAEAPPACRTPTTAPTPPPSPRCSWPPATSARSPPCRWRAPPPSTAPSSTPRSRPPSTWPSARCGPTSSPRS